MRHEMVRRWIVAAVALFAAAVQPALAWEPQSTGVVLMHGKWGSPNDAPTRPLADALRAAGFLVDQPEMPWSGRRLYDRGFDDAMDEIDAAIARLKTGGADKIVVAGQSLGGCAAVLYASLGRPLDAVVLVAPAHAPEGRIMGPASASSVAEARRMAAAGRGDDSLGIMDFNDGGRTRSLSIRARIYLTYYAPEGPAAMSLNAAKLGPAPVLWISGTLDPTGEFFAKAVWPRISAATPKERVDVVANHLDVPSAGRATVVAWLRAR